MRYSKLPQWMRDKIFCEPDAEVVIVFKYDGNPFEYWRNVGIIADTMGYFSHLLSSTGVRGVTDCRWLDYSHGYSRGVVRLSDFTRDLPGLARELDYCLDRLTCHGVPCTSWATVSGFVFNGKNTMDIDVAALHPQAQAKLGVYGEVEVKEWLRRNRQDPGFDPEDWPYDYMYDEYDDDC